MNAAQLLAELRAAGAELRVVDGRLQAKRLPPHLRSQAQAQAVALRLLLAPPACAPPAGSEANGAGALSAPARALLARVQALVEAELGARLVEVRPRPTGRTKPSLLREALM